MSLYDRLEDAGRLKFLNVLCRLDSILSFAHNDKVFGQFYHYFASLSTLGLAFYIIFFFTDPIYALYPKQVHAAGLGQMQTYTVIFQENGDAQVQMKTLFRNNTDESLSRVRFTFSGSYDVDDMSGYQFITRKICQKQTVCTSSERYESRQIEMHNQTADILLDRPIGPGAYTNIMLTYRTKDFVKRNLFGGYEYTFTSLATENEIAHMAINIKVVKPYELRKTSLHDKADMSNILAAKNKMQNIEKNTFDGRVEYATHIPPHSEIEVQGIFGLYWFQLYVNELITGLLFLVSLSLFIIMVIHRVVRQQCVCLSINNNLHVKHIPLVVIAGFAAFLYINTVLMLWYGGFFYSKSLLNNSVIRGIIYSSIFFIFVTPFIFYYFRYPRSLQVKKGFSIAFFVFMFALTLEIVTGLMYVVYTRLW